MRKTGEECFHLSGERLNARLLEFWQWSASDLVSNATRGVLAEYIVALALEGSPSGIRREWDAYDLKLSDGTKVEVKSAAYVQSWKQTRPSTILFNVGKRRWWDAETGMSTAEPTRHADVYVFALLKHTERETLDPLNISQWDFFVLPTNVLNERTRSQQSITLASLAELTGDPVAFGGLKEAVAKAAAAFNG